MTTYDLHAHIMTVDAVDEMRAAFPDHAPRLVERDAGTFLEYANAAPMGPLAPGMFDLDLRIRDMNRQRVDVQLISAPPSNFFYHLPGDVGEAFAAANNDAMYALSKARPDRFQVFATLPMQDVDAALRELDRIAPLPFVRGVEIGTNIAGVDLDATEFDVVWTALCAADLPIWLHPDQRTIAGSDRLARYYLQNLIGNPLETTIAIASLIFGGVLERHPTLRVGVVHGGGFAPYQAGRWWHGWEVRPEPRAQVSTTSPDKYFDRITFDSLTHSKGSLRFLGETFGWDQVVVGSDYPFDMGPTDPVVELESLKLGPEHEHAVKQSNAERFLRPL